MLIQPGGIHMVVYWEGGVALCAAGSVSSLSADCVTSHIPVYWDVNKPGTKR